jgi:arabinofuranosyltransferase
MCLLTRLDLAPLVLPIVLAAAWKIGWRRAIAPLAVGMMPLLAWEVFSAFYYGSFVPNTAYAKLNTVMTARGRLVHGLQYLLRAVTGDPATMPVIAAGILIAAAASRRRDWPLALGLALYLAYVVRIGGDWMMGRFLTPAFVVSLALLARAEWLAVRRRAAWASAAVVALGLMATWEPAIASGYGYSFANNLLHGRHSQRPLDDETKTFIWGVMDERRFYSESNGLIKASSRGAPYPKYEWSVEGLQLRQAGPRVIVASNIGMLGYFAGPGVHIIDPYGLGDPLLARLPGGTAQSYMSHFYRQVPAGYFETIATGLNRIVDPDLAAYYDRLHLVISGPLWSAARFRAIAALLSGRDDWRIARYAKSRGRPSS